MTISRRSFAKGAVAVGLLGRAATARAQSLPKLVVRVDFSPWGMHAGLHLGVEKGWFKEAGLDVEVSDGKGTGIVLPQVASGDVDVGWVQLGAMAVASRKGDSGYLDCWLGATRGPRRARAERLRYDEGQGSGRQESRLHRRHQLGRDA